LNELQRARADVRQSLPATHPRAAVLDCIEALVWQRRGDPRQARQCLGRCAAGLSGFPPDNYRQRWLSVVTHQIRVPG
jgi:hypothetical protein